MQQEPSPESQRHDPYAAFRLRDYRRYVTGWLAVFVGTQMQSVALQWEIYSRTEEAFSLALIGLFQIMPALALLLPAGHIADTHDRRRVIAMGMAGTTVTSVGLFVASLHESPVAWFYGLLFLDATFLTLARPARSALLPLIVPASKFSNAVTWNSSLGQLALMVGPALGGAVVAWKSPAAAYLLCALGSIYFCVVVSRMSIVSPPRAREPMSVGRLLSGARFVWRSPLVFGAIGMDMLAVLLGGATYLLPIYAKDILHVGELGFGLLRAAPAVGALLMSLVIAHLPPMQKAGRNLLWAVAVFGLATIVFGLSEWFVVSLLALAITGAADNISVVIRHSLVQLATPDAMRGRVSAVNSVFIGISNEMGGFRAGSMAQLLGPVVAVVVGGIGTIAVVAGSAAWLPALRRLRRFDDIQPDPAWEQDQQQQTAGVAVEPVANKS